MKKIIILLVLLISILLVPGCKKIDNLIEDGQSKVNDYIKETKDISKETITESVDYILKKFDKKINKEYIYHATLLNTISKNNFVKDCKITELASNAYNYILDKTEDNKDKLEDIVREVKKDKDKLIDDFYNKYKNYIESNAKLVASKTKLIVELREKDSINSKKINKAIDYILLHYKKPFANEEVLDKCIYYSMYLDTIGTKKGIDNDVIKIGKNMKKYIQEQNDKYISKIDEIKDNVNTNKNTLVEEIINKE